MDGIRNMTDRELLEDAAKAAGLTIEYWAQDDYPVVRDGAANVGWSPLKFDSDALRLAVNLNLQPRQGVNLVSVLRPDAGWNDENYRDHGGDKFSATRRAIVCAAASMVEHGVLGAA